MDTSPRGNPTPADDEMFLELDQEWAATTARLRADHELTAELRRRLEEAVAITVWEVSHHLGCKLAEARIEDPDILWEAAAHHATEVAGEMYPEVFTGPHFNKSIFDPALLERLIRILQRALRDDQALRRQAAQAKVELP
jgi:hypothetical protein